jgi:ligand-binding SRPBCC domain-containing protein
MKTDGPAKEGRIIELHCRDWWVIPMHWTCRWKTVQPPRVLVDEIVSGPFEQFIHEHRFEMQGPKRCVMHDTVTYQWGRSWWGKLVSETGVRLYLTLLFKYRHQRTRLWALRNQHAT